jgi:hypothetical protein
VLIAFAASHEVDDLWPLFEQKIKRACERYRSDLTPPLLWKMCVDEDAYLMVAHDGTRPLMVSVWKFYNWPDGLVFRCLCLAGERSREWRDQTLSFAVDTARNCGAKVVTWNGRKGWGGVYPSAREVYRAYEVEVQC